MKLLDHIILALCVALLIIGVHQTIVLGFNYAYWIFMLIIMLFFWYKLRQKQRKDAASPPQKQRPKRK